jgi:hypothetical protein
METQDSQFLSQAEAATSFNFRVPGLLQSADSCLIDLDQLFNDPASAKMAWIRILISQPCAIKQLSRSGLPVTPSFQFCPASGTLT